MTTLVVGGTGATGKLLIEALLNQGQMVKTIVRSPDKLPESIKGHPNLTIIKASLLDLNESEMQEAVEECQAIASCLGHNLTFKGVYGHPRRLVTDAVRRLCAAARFQNETNRVKFVLMNTVGNQNRDLKEPISMAQKIVIGLLRLLLPPHVDNEQASDVLRVEIGQNNPTVEWVVVRPDSLLNKTSVSEYKVHPSPTRSAIFNPGQTSRINVAHFMAELITNETLWEQWKGQMPVIYNFSD